MNTSPCSAALGHLLRRLLLLPLALLLEVLLLRLGVEGGELGVALGLLDALALGGALLGGGGIGLLAELRRLVVAGPGDLAQDLGAELDLRDEVVGDADVLLEEGRQVRVVVVAGKAVTEEDALAGGGGLLETARC